MGRNPKSYYKYDPLPRGSIRLAKIHPTKSVKDSKRVVPLETYPFDEQLEVSLETFKRSDCPRYTALSYTWGLSGSFADPKPSVFTQIERVYPIICHGDILLSTWNLRSALRRIRLGIDVCTREASTENEDLKRVRDLYVDISYIWIDAVCIDQGNLRERSHQVQAMSKIYKQAHTTLVWLGDNDRFSKDALAALGKLAEHLKKVSTQEALIRASIRISPLHLDAPERKACAALLSRNWFSRYWILQEVVMSKEVLVLIGKGLASFTYFHHTYVLSPLADFLITDFDEGMNDVDPIDLRLHNQARGSIHALYHMETARKHISKGKLPDFMSVINMSRSLKCSDPRDALYSILGICSEFCKDGKILLEPDYTKPVSEVFLQATSFIIRARNDLAVLNLPSTRRSIPNLPSWCPDFLHLTGTISNFTEQSRPWRLPDSPKESVQVYNHSLEVYGQRIGGVNEVVFFLRREDSHLDPLQEWLRTGPAPICSLVTRIETGGSAEALFMQKFSRVELLWRTIMVSQNLLCLAQLADCYENPLPSGVSLILPQLLRAMLILHLAQDHRLKVDATTLERNFGRPIPPQILEAYSHIFDTSLAWLITYEPQNVPFLPQGRELQEFCLDHNRNPTVNSSPLVKATEDEHKDLRRKAQILSLDLPESFTRPPQIWLTDKASYQAHETAMTWHIGFINGLVPLYGATVFRTETHLFGMTTCSLQKDDEIWILDGAFAPICLRPLPNGKYQFIGEAHMEGIMNGEAVPFCEHPISITLE